MFECSNAPSFDDDPIEHLVVAHGHPWIWVWSSDDEQREHREREDHVDEFIALSQARSGWDFRLGNILPYKHAHYGDDLFSRG